MPFISFRAIGLIAATFTLYLIVSATPARLMQSLLHKALPELELQAVSGTLWKGKAAGAQWNLAPHPLALGAVSWQFHPLKLATLKACISVKNEHFSGEACKSLLGPVQLQQVTAEVPAALVNPWLSVQNAAIEGTFMLHLAQLQLSAKGIPSQLQGSLAWHSAKVSINNMGYPLGDYHAALGSTPQGAWAFNIKDESGPIKVKLQAQLTPGKSPQVHGEINPSEQAPAAVRDALSLVATPGENGALQIKYPLGS